MTKQLAMIEGRTDISEFLVHLTRDDTNTFGEAGRSARDNFLSILEAKEITAYLPHGLYGGRVPEIHAGKFKTTCYTETPLPELKHITAWISGRRINLEPWGFVFNREFMIDKSAQQVKYVNSYPTSDPVREAFDEIFDSAVKFGFVGKKWKVLPFVSAIQPGHDFGWEREWRIRGSLSFDYSDLVCVIVPDDVDVAVKKKLGNLAVPMYTPGWSMERFMLEVGNQLRRVKRLAAPPKPLSKPLVKATRK